MAKSMRWVLYTLTGAVVGIVSGYVCGWLWFFFAMIFLGYGDSGPSWLNTIDHLLLFIGLGMGVAGGQVLFLIDMRRRQEEARVSKAGRR